MTKNWINDAGHGGVDGGANAKGNLEKVYTLEAGLYVDERLRQHGIVSAVTRDKDIDMTNNQRTNLVKQYKKCISHHYNAGGGKGVEFIRSIYSDGIFESLLVEEFTNAGLDIRSLPVYTRKGSNGKDYYFMHRETGSCRTTIIEYDFVDGANSEKIKSKSYREGMYECVVRAVCREEGVKYIPVGQANPINSKTNAPHVTGDFFRVITGSFNDRGNAENRVSDLKKAGFDSFVELKGGYNRVITGSFNERNNAEKRVSALNNKGFDSFIDVIRY